MSLCVTVCVDCTGPRMQGPPMEHMGSLSANLVVPPWALFRPVCSGDYCVLEEMTFAVCMYMGHDVVEAHSMGLKGVGIPPTKCKGVGYLCHGELVSSYSLKLIGL